MDRVRHLVIISLLSGLAVVIYALESMIPTPSPWLRFGFSHIIILFTILFFGTRVAFLVFLVRTVVGSLIIGKLFSPTFILGLGGGLSAVLLMAVLLFLLKGKVLGIVGISVSGAWVNNLVQVTLAYVVFIRHEEIFLILPLFLLFAVGTGLVNGIAVFFLNSYGQRVLGLKNRYFPVN